MQISKLGTRERQEKILQEKPLDIAKATKNLKEDESIHAYSIR